MGFQSSFHGSTYSRIKEFKKIQHFVFMSYKCNVFSMEYERIRLTGIEVPLGLVG
jgi:hypothetical protein